MNAKLTKYQKSATATNKIVQTQTKKKKNSHYDHSSSMWALTDSNRRPSACKADALNQLS